MIRNSLAARIIALSSVWVLLALIVSAISIAWFYRDHIESHFDAHLLSHLEELVHASRFNTDGSFELTAQPSDPHFQDPDSGWYWEIRQGDQVLERSESLGSGRLRLLNVPAPGAVYVREVTRDDQRLRAQVITVARPDGGVPTTFVTSAPHEDIRTDVGEFGRHIIESFVILAVGLMLAVLVQVRIALKPLKGIGKGITEIRDGNAQKLDRAFPPDVQPLVDELNKLLEHNAVLLKQARNQLGDLAHAVKNPLTVIKNEAQQMEGEKGAIILQQATDLARNVDHFLSRARALGRVDVLGTGADVRLIVDDLVFVMQRVFQDRRLELDFAGVEDCRFRGDAQDLEEMLGNLLDNACKWARSRVVLRCSCQGQRLLLTVDDDGPGIPEELIERALQRGSKLDESTPGHGLGLGIVRDLAELCDGKLTLTRSDYGGLRAELELPARSSKNS